MPRHHNVPDFDNEGQHPDILTQETFEFGTHLSPVHSHRQAIKTNHNASARVATMDITFARFNDAPCPPPVVHVVDGVPQTDRGRELLAEANRKLAAGLDPQERGNDAGCILGDNKLREGRRRLMMAGEKRSIGLWSKRSSASGS